jgi:glycosyltransferase involved in cell wall biosynthesis
MDKLTLSDKPLNVMEVIGNAIVGGMETYVARFISRLPQEHFRVICLCPFESEFTAQLRAQGCQVFIAQMNDDPSWHAIQVATMLVRTHAIDVIHAHMANAHLLAGLAGKLTSTPVLSTIHSRTLSLSDLEVHRLTDTYLSVVSQLAYLQALSVGVKSERLHFIPNGVDSTRFSVREKSAYLHDRLGIPATTPLIGFIGRLSPEKGPEVFLRMAWLVAQKLPDVHFAFIGEGPMLDRLRSAAEDMEFSDRLHFAGTLSDMPKAYASLDLAVMSSYSEGMPLALLEAMACGLAVVATHTGGVADIIEVGTTGLMRAPGDYEGLAQAVVKLMSQPELRQAMGQAARRRAEKHFSLDISVTDMANLLTFLGQSSSRKVGIGYRMASVSDVESPATLKRANGGKTKGNGREAL